MAAFTKPFTLTAQSGPAIGPVVSGNFINIDFANPTGHTLPMWLFGSSMASDVDFLGGTGSTGWSQTSVQNTAKTTAGFGLPGMFARCNTNETSFNTNGNNNTFNDRVSAFLPNIISMPTSASDVAHGQFSYSLGVNSPSIGNGEGGFAGSIGPVTPSQYGTFAVQCAQRFVSNGTPIYYWEVGNEADGRLDVNEYCRLVNSTAVALKGFDPSYKIIAGVIAGDVGFLQTVAQQCGANLDIMSYHHYSTNPSDFGGMANQVRNAMQGTACANKPAMQGEFNQNGDGTGNSSQQTNNGMMTNISALYNTWKADPNTLIGAIWDWLGDANYGLIGDPANGTPPGVPGNTVIQTGYALKNLRAHMGGPDGTAGTEVAINRLDGALQAIATKNGNNIGLWLINFTGGPSNTGQIAFSSWPINTTGNATLNVYTVNDAHPQSQTTTLAVTGGLSASIQIPANSIVVISST